MPSHSKSHVIFTMQKHNRVKRQSLLIACSFECLYFWMYDQSPYACVFWKAALNLNQCHQPFPEPHEQAFTSSENTKHSPRTSGRRRTFREHCRVPPQSGSPPTMEGVGIGVQLSPRSPGTAAPLWLLTDHVPSASKGSIALDVQQTAGRKG